MPPALAAAAVVALVWGRFGDPDGGSLALDADLCPTAPESLNGKVAFLFDFRKPLDEPQAKLPGQLLQDLTLALGRNTEIRVHLLAGSADAPRVLLKRFCKPFGPKQIQAAMAKDQADGEARDCDDLPAQLAADVRSSAKRFCALRDSLRERLDRLAANPGRGTRAVADAYLIEALEEFRMEFQQQRGPHRLHVLSDMMQHAPWHSHLDAGWAQWGDDDFLGQLAHRNRPAGWRATGRDADVHIHYLPLAGKTEEPQARESHQQFWRSYFASARVAFQDQSVAPIPTYAWRPLLDAQAAGSQTVTAAGRPAAPANRRNEQATLSEGAR